MPRLPPVPSTGLNQPCDLTVTCSAPGGALSAETLQKVHIDAVVCLSRSSATDTKPRALLGDQAVATSKCKQRRTLPGCSKSRCVPSALAGLVFMR